MKKTWKYLPVLAVLLVAGCGSSDAAEVKECIDQMKQTLQESGNERPLTADENDACNDPTKRAFILGN